ncbi:MAG: alpha/beta fold hydrolase, partial [Planctomycetota bacterium]
IEAALADPTPGDKEALFSEYGNLLTKADTFDALPQRNEVIDFQPRIYHAVWPEAAELRRTGELLELGKRIQCPVTAIHGDYDSHPAEGVEIPLKKVLPHSRFILLEKCGHSPWIERHARGSFFEVLEAELG